MIRGEIEIARSEADSPGGKPRILPIRAAFVGELPYPLNSYLSGLQYALWRGESDTEPLLESLRAVADGGSLSPQPDVLFASPASSHAQRQTSCSGELRTTQAHLEITYAIAFLDCMEIQD
jgi:hypothetical protein